MGGRPTLVLSTDPSVLAPQQIGKNYESSVAFDAPSFSPSSSATYSKKDNTVGKEATTGILIYKSIERQILIIKCIFV